ncbi:MAG TPA: ABC transporter permease, partial [Gemmatimonadaceae bacterium]
MRARLDRFFGRVRAATLLLAGHRDAHASRARIDEEFAFHVEMATKRYVAAGMSADEARRTALLDFGGTTRMTELVMDERRSRPLDDFVRDLRVGVRSLLRDRAFAAVTIATIGLGIAAVVTVMSFVDAIFLRPLSVPEASRLVHVYFDNEHGERGWLGLEGAKYLRDHSHSFDVVAAHRSRAMVHVTAHGQQTSQFAAFVTPEYFRALGVRPALGRFFLPQESEVPDRDFVAVLGYRTWQNQFGGDSGVIGSDVVIQARRVRVIGVAPEGFEGIAVGGMPNTMWLPAALLHFVGPPCAFKHPCREVSVLGRLAPGVSERQALAELGTLARGLSVATYADDSTRTMAVQRLSGVPPEYRAEYRAIARLLSAIAVLLLITACANLSGLLLARGVARRREIALRVAIGAGRLRIIRQLLSESLVIAIAGGTLGTWLSTLPTAQLMRLFSRDDEGFQHLYPFGLDHRLLTASLILSAAVTLTFGLVPAITAARTDPGELIKQGASRAVDARLRLALVATQVALSILMVIGAGLLVR